MKFGFNDLFADGRLHGVNSVKIHCYSRLLTLFYHINDLRFSFSHFSFCLELVEPRELMIANLIVRFLNFDSCSNGWMILH